MFFPKSKFKEPDLANKDAKSNKPNLFNYIETLFTSYDHPDPVNIPSTYIVNKLLSRTPETFFEAQLFNKYMAILEKRGNSHHFLTNIITKTNVPFIKTVKFNGNKKEEVVEKLRQTYNCSEQTAVDYMQILEQKGVNVKETYGLE